MQKIILTALFLLVMASFFLEPPGQTRLQEDNPALPNQNDRNAALARKPDNLKMFPADTFFNRKADILTLFADSPGKIKPQKTSQAVEDSFKSSNYPIVNPIDAN